MNELAIQVLSLILALIVSLGGVVAYFRREFNILHSRVNSVIKDISEWKLKTAENYASQEMLGKTEARITKHVDELSARVDRGLEQMGNELKQISRQVKNGAGSTSLQRR